MFNKIKQLILNHSNQYKFYESEYNKNQKLEEEVRENAKCLKKLQDEFKRYKIDNDMLVNSHYFLFNQLFVYNEIKPKPIVKLSRELTLELLDFIGHVCEKHDLQWWMYGGTLLGAVRHGGYIPWDDDIDLCMMRQDYEKFYEIFQEEVSKHCLSENITITNSRKTPTGIYLPFIKIEFRIDGKLFSFVDVFPMDYVTDVVEDYRNVHKRENKLLCEKLNQGQDRQTCLNEAFEMLHVSKVRTDILMIGVEETVQLIYDFDTIFPLKTLKFEDRFYPCPNDYEKDLQNLYGDNYMQIPKDISSHGFYEHVSSHEDVYAKYDIAINKLHDINQNF